MVHIRRPVGETETIRAVEGRFSNFCTCFACAHILVCKKDEARYAEDEVQGINIYIDYQ